MNCRVCYSKGIANERTTRLDAVEELPQTQGRQARPIDGNNEEKEAGQGGQASMNKVGTVGKSRAA